MSTFLNLRPFVSTVGGLNLRDPYTLEKSETSDAKNVHLLQEGGWTKSPGLRDIYTLPTDGQGFIVHELPSGRFELLVYHYPFISRYNPVTNVQDFIRTSNGREYLAQNTGRPRYCQDGPGGKTHIVDGKNNPIYYNGNIITSITWPPSYSTDNNTQLESSYAQADNPSESGFPHDCEFYENRVFYITRSDVGRAFVSKAGNSIDFSSNSGSPPPIDIAFFVDFPVTTPFTAVRKTSNGLMFYEQNGTSRMTGKNAPLPGLPDKFEFNKINYTVGVVGPHALIQLPNNEHIGVSQDGFIQGALSDNFNQLRPVAISYKIQPDLDKLTRESLARGSLVNITKDGTCLFIAPRGSQYTVNSKIYKFFYGVGEANKTLPWMIDEHFNLGETDIRDAIYFPGTRKTYFLIKNKIYEWDGTAYGDEPIQSHYEYPPEDFSVPGVNKYVSALYILYRSESGAKVNFIHSWENGRGGSQLIDLPAKSYSLNKDAIIGVTKLRNASTLKDSAFRIPLSGCQIGKNFTLRVSHGSDEEDLSVYGIFAEYELMSGGI